jgi:hypothetical protein
VPLEARESSTATTTVQRRGARHPAGFVERSCESPTAYVVSLNLQRRHLTDGRRAAIAVEAKAGCE